jgi:CheY-like chemotaxis protein
VLTEAAVSGYEGARKSILVVDDVAENRQVAAEMLRPLGFTVAEAANGREGLEKAQTLQPDLILMDIIMPEMDGLETMRRLRQAGKDVPIIAISASASGDNEADSLAAGANAFLPKPVDLRALLTQIGTLLKLSWTYGQPGAIVPEPVVVGPLPVQEMETLYRLARLGNMREIVRWATQLAGLDERYRPFAAQLCQLANNYQSQAILNLAKQCLKEKGIH